MCNVSVAFRLIILCVIATIAESKVISNSRIVGGSAATLGAHPYLISLRNADAHLCGGVIISSEWIVTSAKCVPNSPSSSVASLTILAGSNSLNSGGKKYKVLEVHTHDGYKGDQNDVAVLKVEKITFVETIASIVMDNSDVKGGEMCTISGWGMLNVGGSLTEKLQEITVATITLEECREKLLFNVSDSEICTYTKFGEGVCLGDYGGPLTRTVNGTKKLVGVVSRSHMPCAKGFPDLHTRISSYIDWINQKCANCLKNNN